MPPTVAVSSSPGRRFSSSAVLLRPTAALLLVLAVGTGAARAACGDGVVEPEREACDDGNQIDDDGCTADCHVVAWVATDGNDGTGDGTSAKPWRTIQCAVDAAVEFTRIVVRPGTYNECVRAAYHVPRDRPLAIVAEAWTARGDNTATVITGAGLCDSAQPTNQRAPVVRIGSRASRLEGFTITRGGASGVRAWGVVAITNNVITQNFSTFGGGVYFYSGTAYIADDIHARIAANEITGNHAIYGVPPGGDPGDLKGGDGGGVFVFAVGRAGRASRAPTRVTVEDNEIRDNYAGESSSDPTVAVHGGGLGVFTSSEPNAAVEVVVTRNVIADNGVQQGAAGYGGGAWLYTYGYGSETLRFEDNTVEGNRSTLDGGGVSAWVTAFGTQHDLDPDTRDSRIRHDITVAGNAIHGNAAGGSGGGLDTFAIARDLSGTERARIEARDNDVTENTALGGANGGGGGVLATFTSWRSATPESGILLEQNRVTDNTAAITGGGVALWVEADSEPLGDPGASGPWFAEAEVTLRRNLVARNRTADLDGAGDGVFALLQAFVDAAAQATIDRTTVMHNEGQSGGSGIYVEAYVGFDAPPDSNAQATLTVSNSIVAANGALGIGGPEPGVDEGLLAPADGSGNLVVDVTFSDVWGHGEEYGPWIDDPTDLNGNLSVDPDLDDDTALPAYCSPTVDTAHPALEYAAEPGPNGGRANMGHTSGTSQAATSIPDVDGDRFVDGRDVLRLSVAFGTVAGDPRYSTAADLDGTGMVDGEDLALVATGFGEVCR